MTRTATDESGSVDVRVERDVAIIEINRPRKLNALSTRMEGLLLNALQDSRVRGSAAVVVTGGATVFSAGADTTELTDMNPEAIAEYYRTTGAVYEVLANMPQPTIAAIAGYCIGGGFELALAADFRVADPSALFGFPEVGIGILPCSGGVTRISRVVGAGRARDLVLRGRRIDAETAESWGVITEIAPAGAQLDRAVEIAHEVIEFAASPLTLSITKQVLDTALDSNTQTSLIAEQLAYAALKSVSDKA